MLPFNGIFKKICLKDRVRFPTRAVGSIISFNSHQCVHVSL